MNRNVFQLLATGLSSIVEIETELQIEDAGKYDEGKVEPL